VAALRLLRETNLWSDVQASAGALFGGTWVWRRGRWQIVAAEDLIAPESPR